GRGALRRRDRLRRAALGRGGRAAVGAPPPAPGGRAARRHPPARAVGVRTVGAELRDVRAAGGVRLGARAAGGRLRPPLPGTPAAAQLDSAGIRVPDVPATLLGGDTARVEQYVPGAAALLATLCPTEPGDDAGVLVGTVRGAAPASVVELSWGGTRGVRGSM